MTLLLAVLAVLQFWWIGQISDAERDRMRARLETDSKRFAEDFNREIQSAVMNFLFSYDFWQGNDFGEFATRYDYWRDRAAHPDLIKTFVYFEPETNRTLVFSDELRSFSIGELPPELSPYRDKFTAVVETGRVIDDLPAIVMPIYQSGTQLDRLLVKVESDDPPKPIIPVSKGYFIVVLDRAVVSGKILGDLAKTYFGAPNNPEFDVSVRNASGTPVFETKPLSDSDLSVRTLSMNSPDFLLFTARGSEPNEKNLTRSVVFSSTTKTVSSTLKRNSNMAVEVVTEDVKPRISMREISGDSGVWTLNVRHSSGSLEQFIAATRYRNLAVSFGILALVGGSAFFVVISAQRARRFAQRQVDFVSSVSHEFRTPLAVIYSASENLADGVAKDREQISRYGELIKSEGRKLSAMVEQILEFAGARAGKRRYELATLDGEEVLDEAIAECDALLADKGFVLERESAGALPINGDRVALVGAFANLITNAVKYSNGNKWLRVANRTEGQSAIFEFEDRGIGIEPTDIDQIFEPFFRAKAVVDEQIHGSGLGLSLVRDTVVAHGGSIKVESRPASGSKFTVRIPRISGDRN